jgi:hypothetical protein
MNLFKLKKDGKVVGYARLMPSIQCDFHLFVSKSIRKNLQTWRPSFKKYIQADSIHPYVCDDKNSEPVFVGDKVDYVSHKAIVRQNDGDFGYHLEFTKLQAMSPIKTDRKLTNVLYQAMFKEIELIKDSDE